jgi:hypothetical protein
MLLVVVDPVPLALTATPVSRLSSRQPVPTKMLGNQAHGTPTRLGDRRVAEECDLRRATSGEKWTTPPRAETRRLELQWRESQPRPTRRWSLHFSLRLSLPSMLTANGSGHGSGQRAAGSRKLPFRADCATPTFPERTFRHQLALLSPSRPACIAATPGSSAMSHVQLHAFISILSSPS